MKNIIISIVLFFISVLSIGQIWDVPYDSVYHDGDTITGIADKYFTNGRTILRSWGVGITIPDGTNAFEWMFFAPPTITMAFDPSTSLYEIGTSTTIAIAGSTSNPGGATLSSGHIENVTDGISMYSFPIGNETTFSTNITYAPTQSGTVGYYKAAYTFRASQNWVFGTENGITTYNVSISAVYPMFYFISSADFTTATGTTIYDEYIAGRANKLITTQGTKSLTFTGTGYMYIITPSTWTDLSAVKDETGSTVSGFTKYDITISSVGLSGTDYINAGFKLWASPTSGTYTGQTYTIYF